MTNLGRKKSYCQHERFDPNDASNDALSEVKGLATAEEQDSSLRSE
jgi:hypothetical protein